MKTREDNPKDWFMLAEDRLRGADVLYGAEGVTYLGVEALHEAVERYLKGFLVSRGWRIERTHNLPYLLDCAMKYQSLQNCLHSGLWHGRPARAHGRDGRATTFATIDTTRV